MNLHFSIYILNNSFFIILLYSGLLQLSLNVLKAFLIYIFFNLFIIERLTFPIFISIFLGFESSSIMVLIPSSTVSLFMISYCVIESLYSGFILFDFISISKTFLSI